MLFKKKILDIIAFLIVFTLIHELPIMFITSNIEKPRFSLENRGFGTPDWVRTSDTQRRRPMAVDLKGSVYAVLVGVEQIIA